MSKTIEYIGRSMAIWLTTVIIGAIPAAVAFDLMGGLSPNFLDTAFTVIVFSGLFSFPAPFIMLGSFFALDKVALPKTNKRWILVAVGVVTAFVSLSAFGVFLDDSQFVIMFVPIYVIVVSLSILLWTHKYNGNLQKHEV